MGWWPDAYADMMQLLRFTPTVIGATLEKPEGETAMDLEVAPDHIKDYGWACDRIDTAADLAPLGAAVQTSTPGPDE